MVVCHCQPCTLPAHPPPVTTTHTSNDRGTGLAALLDWGLVLKRDDDYCAVSEADALEYVGGWKGGWKGGLKGGW